MFGPTSKNRCPNCEAPKGTDYLPSVGSSGQGQFGAKRRFIFLGGSCSMWNNPFSSHRLGAPHFHKEKPKAKQKSHSPSGKRTEKNPLEPSPCNVQRTWPYSLARVTWDQSWCQRWTLAMLPQANMGSAWGSVPANFGGPLRHKCFLSK